MSKAFLDESALQELTKLLDEAHPHVILAAFQGVDDGDAAVFLIMLQTASEPFAAHAGKIFARIPFERQVSIAEQVATTEVVESERAQQIWKEQVVKIKEALQQTTFLGEGATNLAKLLSDVDIAKQNQLLETLAEKQPEVVASVSEQLLTFDDLVNFGNEAIETILQVLDKPTLALALYNAPQAIQDRFFENMSAAQAEAVESETVQLTFEQTQIVETARQSVVNLVRNFAAKGLLKLQ